MKGIVTQGKFGYSFAYRRDVGELIGERLLYTLILALAAHSISTVVGISIGIYVAQRKYSFWTMRPRYWLLCWPLSRVDLLVIAYMMVFVFGQHHITSFFSPEYALAPWSVAKVGNFIQHVWPVVFIAGLGGVARNMRVIRGNLLDVLTAQYVTTARSKGLEKGKVIRKHACRTRCTRLSPTRARCCPICSRARWKWRSCRGLPFLAAFLRIVG